MNTSDSPDIAGLREIIAELNRSNAVMLATLEHTFSAIERHNKGKNNSCPWDFNVALPRIKAAIATARKVQP